MIEDARVVMSACGESIRGKDKWRDFHDGVVSSWTKLGVFEMELVKISPVPHSK